MISRQWLGLARPECADDYVEHLRTDTFVQIGVPSTRSCPRMCRMMIEFDDRVRHYEVLE